MNRRLRLEVLARDGKRCAYCGVITTGKNGPNRTRTVIEHSFGPLHQDIGYLVVSCRRCNSVKNRMSAPEWLSRIDKTIQEARDLSKIRHRVSSVISTVLNRVGAL